MRRADRLFQIVQQLRHDRVTTARELAEVHHVSERTIYRDMQDLSLSGIPIVGETGTGYRLLPGFELPPLMFNDDELTALLLGARMVMSWSDKHLSQAAKQALAKIEAVVPTRLKPELSRLELMTPGFSLPAKISEQLGVLRQSIRERERFKMNYTREDGQHSERNIRPLGLVYWGKVWTLLAWCELRDNFRHFRVDRIDALKASQSYFEDEPGKRLEDFLATIKKDNKPQ